MPPGLAAGSAFLRPRCIYTGKDLDPADPLLKPSIEHIIPLSLGGSDDFTTRDVSAGANARAGNEIDGEVAASFLFMMLRHRYQLRGNRPVLPSIKLDGEFTDVQSEATLDINPDGTLGFQFKNEQDVRGNIISIASTEERVKFLLKARLKQAKKHNLQLLTRDGSIADEEDIDIAVALADRQDAKEFHGRVTINTREHDYAFARLILKIAIGLGHRVLGPEWTFGAGGHSLRRALFARPGPGRPPAIAGSLHYEMPEDIRNIVGVSPDKHVLAVFPQGRTTTATIALFGGDAGIAVVDLNYDSRKLFNAAINHGRDLPCVFTIPLLPVGQKRHMSSRSLLETADAAAQRGLLPPNRAAAKRQALARNSGTKQEKLG